MLVTRATKWPPETKRDATKRAPDPGAPQHHGKTLSRVLLRATLVSAPRSDNKSRAIRSGQLARMRTARILDDYSHPTPASPGEHYGSTNCNSLFLAALGPIIESAHAGPCSVKIAQFELAVRQSAGKPNAGPFAAQSIGAQIDRQPTPSSVKRAEQRAQANFAATLARAKRLDARGNRAGCTRALAVAKDMYNLQ